VVPKQGNDFHSQRGGLGLKASHPQKPKQLVHMYVPSTAAERECYASFFSFVWLGGGRGGWLAAVLAALEIHDHGKAQES